MSEATQLKHVDYTDGSYHDINSGAVGRCTKIELRPDGNGLSGFYDVNHEVFLKGNAPAYTDFTF